MGSISIFLSSSEQIGREDLLYNFCGEERQDTAKRDYPAVVYSSSNIWRRVVCQRYSQVYSVLGGY